MFAQHRRGAHGLIRFAGLAVDVAIAHRADDGAVTSSGDFLQDFMDIAFAIHDMHDVGPFVDRKGSLNNNLPTFKHNQKSLEGVWGKPFFRKVPSGASMQSIEASWKTPLKSGFPNLSLNFSACHCSAMAYDAL